MITKSRETSANIENQLTSTICRKSRTYLRSVSTISATTRLLVDDPLAADWSTHLPPQPPPPEDETAQNETGGDGVTEQQSSEEHRRSRQSVSMNGVTAESLVVESTAITVVVDVDVGGSDLPRWWWSWDDDDDDDDDTDDGEGGSTFRHFWQSLAYFVGGVDWPDMVDEGIVEDWTSSPGWGWGVDRLEDAGPHRRGTCRSGASSGWRWLSRSWSNAVNTVDPRLSDEPINQTSHRPRAFIAYVTGRNEWITQTRNVLTSYRVDKAVWCRDCSLQLDELVLVFESKGKGKGKRGFV